MADILCFRALGRPDLTRGSRPLRLVGRHKPLALFTFLTLSGKSFHSRDVVQATFWPESDRERAGHSLNQALYTLRSELGPAMVLSRGTNEIGVASDSIWSDVRVFDDMITAKEYARALELYRGEFLEGFFVRGSPAFEHWLDHERDRLRRAANEAACGRAELALEQGNHVQAANWARHAAGMAFDDEILVRRAISLLDGVGDRAGAIETFERFSRRLKEEYDAEPAPETERLISDVRGRVEPVLPPEPLEAHRQGHGRETRALLTSVTSAPVQREPESTPPSSEELATSLRDRPSPQLAGFGLAFRFVRRTFVAATILGASVAIGIGVTRQLEIKERLTGGPVEHLSIVVSPFVNLGTTQELEYVPQAITVGLTEQLAQVDAIRLIAEETYAAAGWTDANGSPRNKVGSQEIFMVKGNVLASRDRIRVSISLIDATSGAILRTAAVEKPSDSIFQLIDQVARDLGELLRLELGHEIRLRRWRASTTNTRAWELQQRAEVARQQAKTLEEDGSFGAAVIHLEAADSLLVMAQAEEPTWDVPTVWRARVASDAAWLSFLPPISDTLDARRWIGDGIEHANQVLRRDSALAIALELRGTLRYWSSLIVPASEVDASAALRDAEADLRRAVSIDDRRARAWSLLSALLYSRGEFSESYRASQEAYAADAYLEAREETLVRLAMTAYEIGNDSIAWDWCSAVDAQTPQGAYCRLSLMAWSDVPSSLAPPDPWAILDRVSENTLPAESSTRASLTLLVATALARGGLADSANAVVARTREAGPHDDDLDLLEAGARLALGEADAAAALLRRYVTADPAHNIGTISSRRFSALRELLRDLGSGHRQ